MAMPLLSSSSDVGAPVKTRLEAGVWGYFWNVRDVPWFPVGWRAVECRDYVHLNFPLFLYPCLLKYHFLQKHWIEWSLVLLVLLPDIFLLSQNCPSEIANLNLHLIKLMTTLYKSAAVVRTVKGICFLLVRHGTCKGHRLLILFVWSDMGNINLCSSQRLNRKIVLIEFDNLCFGFSSLMIYRDLFLLCANLYTNFFSHGNCISHHKKEQRKYIICPGVQHVSL